MSKERGNHAIIIIKMFHWTMVPLEKDPGEPYAMLRRGAYSTF